MSSSALHLHDYELRLRRGIRLGYAAMKTRTGVIVALESSDPETIGLGEAAPAWWAGDEPMAATRAALTAARDWFTRSQPDADDLEAALRAGGELPAGLTDALAPSRVALGAVATAVADHQARKAGVSFCEYLGGRLKPCTTNALVVAEDPSAVADEVRRALSLDYRTVKLKVGVAAAQTDLARITAALDSGAGRIRLRLDANRAWTPDQARAVLSRLEPSTVEYVEEPLAEPDAAALARLRTECAIAIALDESIADDVDIDRFADVCDVIVLKPGRVGGPWAFLSRARRATAAGLDVTVTDSLESAVGRATCLHLAAALGDGGRASGLAGAALLDEDMSVDPALMRGAVVTPQGPGLLPLNALVPQYSA